MRSPPTSGKKQVLRALKQAQVQPASVSFMSIIYYAVGALAVVGLLSRTLQADNKLPASGSDDATCLQWSTRVSFFFSRGRLVREYRGLDWPARPGGEAGAC